MDRKQIGSQRRIAKDIDYCKTQTDYKFYVKEHKSGLVVYLAFTIDNNNQYYKGQKHILKIKFRYKVGNEDKIYPFNPPLVKFKTKIWHPNITKTICVSFLHENSGNFHDNWTPTMNIDTIYRSILVLLLVPNDASPLNREAATQLKKDEKQYILKCQQYYNDYKDEYNKMMKKLI